MGSNVTLKQIVEELGLSAMTVSRAINNKGSIDEQTQMRVIKKAKSMGYNPNHVAKSLVSRKTYTIGVVVPEISHSFFPEVIRGIEEIIYKMGYQIILAHSSESSDREKKVIEMLRSKRVDGILISCSQQTENHKYFAELAKSDTPIVFFDRCVEELGVSTVTVNDSKASFQITEHLIKMGYERLAHLSGSQKVSIGKNRLEGFREALIKHNITLYDNLVVEAGFQEDGGYKAMDQIFKLPEEQWPQAVVAVNDPAAFGAIERISEEGLSIPEDIAIVGFSDDIRAEMLPVPLTTVEQPAHEVGHQAANKLLRLISNTEELHERVVVMTKLKIRSSCGAARKSE